MEYIIGGVVSLSATIVALRLYNKHRVWGKYIDLLPDHSLGNVSNIAGKTIIVTGANSGIGKEIVRELYRHGGRIIMACRNEQECRKAIFEIQSSSLSSQSTDSIGELIYKHLDLLCLDSVRSFVGQISREELEIHILINNAAIYNDPVEITEDGFERNMQINHLSQALLTLSLLPKLYSNHLESSSGDKIEDSLSDKQELSSQTANKVIFVTSTLYKKGNVFEELFHPFASVSELKASSSFQSYSGNLYPNTKLANLLFARQLSMQSELVRGVNVSVASPGFAFTRLHRNIPKSRLMLMSLLTPILIPFMRSSRDGAQTIIGCALMNETQPDVLYRNCKSDLKLSFSDPSLGPKVYKWTMDSLKPYL